jgi:hypothetical protein
MEKEKEKEDRALDSVTDFVPETEIAAKGLQTVFLSFPYFSISFRNWAH